MPSPQPQTASDPSAHEALAHEIAALARGLAEESERGRELAPALVERLRASGLMLAGAPRQAGALELAPGLALRCAEEIARGDASAGWCVSISITSSLLAAYVSADARDALFADPRAIAAGVWAPRGAARRVDGGLLVSGRWPYCSGIRHAGVFFAGCIIEAEGEAEERPSVLALLPGEFEILDTWHTL
ncbi:MAG TPA: acyl-CoA dehydrogenase family protein, partial [Solirubrobacteraceae bacterium]|nr:acyl-CoA dehydrogenase family protein [Solirubrobacteraceae bacterium]